MRATLMAAAFVSLAALPPTTNALAPAGTIRPESRLWFTGSSNIRHFTCKARRVAGALDLRGIATQSPALSGANVSGEPSLDVAVTKLDCGIGLMNRHLRDALKGAQYPVIEFRLATYEVDLMAPAPVARIAGRVTIAGVERPVAMTAAVRADTLGRLHVLGAYDVRPTDFGVELPRRFGGLIKVRDRVTVHFDVALDTSCPAVDDIVASLARATTTDFESESTHDSHR